MTHCSSLRPRESRVILLRMVNWSLTFEAVACRKFSMVQQSLERGLQRTRCTLSCSQSAARSCNVCCILWSGGARKARVERRKRLRRWYSLRYASIYTASCCQCVHWQCGVMLIAECEQGTLRSIIVVLYIHWHRSSKLLCYYNLSGIKLKYEPSKQSLRPMHIQAINSC